MQHSDPPRFGAKFELLESYSKNYTRNSALYLDTPAEQYVTDTWPTRLFSIGHSIHQNLHECVLHGVGGMSDFRVIPMWDPTQ